MKTRNRIKMIQTVEERNEGKMGNPMVKKTYKTIDSLLKALKKNPRGRKTAKLAFSPVDVKKIREAYELGATYGDLCSIYKVSRPTIWRVLKGKGLYDRMK